MSFRILSLDGGGIRGVVTATILAAIEQRINQPLNQYFNLIAGTSTGSLLAAAIARGCHSKEIIDLYKQKGKIIFPYKSRFSLQRIPLLLKYGLSAPKFSDSGLIQVLQEALGDTKLLDITTPQLLIVSYDTITREPIIFKRLFLTTQLLENQSYLKVGDKIKVMAMYRCGKLVYVQHLLQVIFRHIN